MMQHHWTLSSSSHLIVSSGVPSGKNIKSIVIWGQKESREVSNNHDNPGFGSMAAKVLLSCFMLVIHSPKIWQSLRTGILLVKSANQPCQHCGYPPSRHMCEEFPCWWPLRVWNGAIINQPKIKNLHSFVISLSQVNYSCYYDFNVWHQTII